MSDKSPRLQPGTLWPTLVERTQHALACGAMQPIATEQEIVEDNGIRFAVRKVSSLARKDEDGKQREQQARGGKRANPFLPYEEDLFVADISATHLALLNKFNVIEHHLLIVTRPFESQEALLNQDDFAALAVCMREVDGLGFYNGGTPAGASQAHKHLQMVPLPLSDSGFPIPIEPLFEAVRNEQGVCSVPALPFVHGFVWIEPALFDDASIAGKKLQTLYRDMLAAVGLKGIPMAGEMRQSAPYNLLLTRRWALLVPRSQECFDSISINALGFAGSLFVRNDGQLQEIKRIGPLAVLRYVAFV